MKITVVNTHDLIGGAQRCSYNLVRQLRAAGDDVHLIVGGKLGDDPFVRKIKYGGIDWRLRSLVHEYLGWTDTTLFAPIRGCWAWPELRDTDVYNLHNMHGAYWNFWTVPILSRRAPVVITLHDEWLLTGDCAYTYNCKRWQDECGRCPQARLRNPIERACIGGGDTTRFNLRLKRRAIGASAPDSIELVSPSQWLLDRATAAPHLSGFRTHRIPYGVDLAVFRPRDRRQARDAHSLPHDRTLLFAPASNLDDPRKNFVALCNSMSQPTWPADVRAVVAGRADDQLRRRFEHLPITWLGFLSEPEEMASAISACDATLLLSTADNLPYVGLESLACGKPIIGANVGGIPEMITEGVTGWLWNLEERELAVLAAMVSSQSASARSAMENAARAAAERHFDVRKEAREYKALFTTARERQGARGGAE